MTNVIEIQPVITRSHLRAFINFPYQLNRHDPHWVPPLKWERWQLLDPKKNPYFEHATASYFLAKQNNKIVGRISAQISRLFHQLHDPVTGHFGCFDCIDNQDVARALVQTAEHSLKDRGMKKMQGPFSLSINEETGVLIEGFDSAPFPIMAHNAPYYDRLLGASGLVKAKDLIAWSYDSKRPVPDLALQVAEAVRAYPGLTLREADISRMDEEMKIISEVFNSAWENNWGFVPWSSAEVNKAARDLKMILDPKLALIAEVDGEPAAISIAIPNYHEAIKDLNGRLFPLGWLKFLYRVKTKKIKSARLALLGIKKKFRRDILKGLSVLLYTEMHRRSQELQHWGGELSWTLEDNEKINQGITLMGGTPYKKYRVYEKDLA